MAGILDHGAAGVFGISLVRNYHRPLRHRGLRLGRADVLAFLIPSMDFPGIEAWNLRIQRCIDIDATAGRRSGR